MQTDALGDPIVIGARYGYSSRDGGWSKTTVGIACHIGKARVTLKDIKVTRYLYGKPCPLDDHANTASVTSHLLFPIRSFPTA